MSAFFSFIALLAVAGIAAASRVDDNFQKCLCWDTETNDFCLGSDWADKEPCKHLFWQLFGWSIPTLLGVIGLLFFPVLFYLSRCLCECCGGRHPSVGRCCPNYRDEFPGYSRVAILIAKALMWALFGGYTYYAVGVYYNNPQLHNSVLDVLDDINAAVHQAERDLQDAAIQVDALANPALPFHLSTPTLTHAVHSATSAVVGRIDQITNVTHNVRVFEDHANYGRANLTYSIPSVPLLVLFLTLCVMLANAKRAVGVFLVLFNYTSVAVGLLFVVHMFAAQIVSTGCSNYNQTVVPLVAGAVESQQGCNDPQVLTGLRELARNLQDTAFTPGQGLCQDVESVCASVSCRASTCLPDTDPKRIPFHSASDSDGLHPWNVAGLQQLVDTPFHGASRQTMLTCYSNSAAAGCPQTAEARQALARVVRFYQTTFDPLDFLLDKMYGATVNCTLIRDDMYGLHNDLCNTLNRQVTTVSMCLGVLFLLAFLGIPVLISGMKRFVKLPGGARAVAAEAFFNLEGHINQVPPAVAAQRVGYNYTGQAVNGRVVPDHQVAPASQNTAVNGDTSLATLPPSCGEQSAEQPMERQHTEAAVVPANAGWGETDALLSKSKA